MGREQILTDEDVSELMRSLREAGFPRDMTISAGEDIADYASGPTAAAAIHEIVARIPEDALSDLVRKHVMPEAASRLPSETDYTAAAHLVRERLIARGIRVEESSRDGWNVVAPDGEILTAPFRSHYVIRAGDQELPTRGVALCRLALLCVWLHATDT